MLRLAVGFELLGVFLLPILMSKQLPYYQFEVAEYMAGEVSEIMYQRTRKAALAST